MPRNGAALVVNRLGRNRDAQPRSNSQASSRTEKTASKLWWVTQTSRLDCADLFPGSDRTVARQKPFGHLRCFQTRPGAGEKEALAGLPHHLLGKEAFAPGRQNGLRSPKQDVAWTCCSSVLRWRVAYFSPSWTAFQVDRGRCFSVMVDGISD